jgi:flagellar export protein FliJ
MGFHFSLETVLRFRESVEQREELALQKTQLEIAGVGRAIDRATAEIASAQRARERAMQQAIPAAQLQAMVRDADAAVEKKKHLVAMLQELEKQRAEQMNAYQAAHRKRRMLSDMETRQQDAYEREQVRTQQKQLDDLFGSRHQRG